MQSHFAQSRLIWTPKEPNRRRIEAFRRYVNHKHGLKLRASHETERNEFHTLMQDPGNFEELHEYSVTVDQFWKDIWDYAEVIYSKPPDKVRPVQVLSLP